MSADARSVSLPAITLPELYDPATGQLDALRMAEYLSVPLKRLAATLGRNYQSLHKTPASPASQSELFTIKRGLDVLIQVLVEHALILAWLNSPHPDLDMETPLKLILSGYAREVEAMLLGAMAGIPA